MVESNPQPRGQVLELLSANGTTTPLHPPHEANHFESAAIFSWRLCIYLHHTDAPDFSFNAEMHQKSSAPKPDFQRLNL